MSQLYIKFGDRLKAFSSTLHSRSVSALLVTLLHFQVTDFIESSSLSNYCLFLFKVKNLLRQVRLI